jgi:riboflavin kinase/FMN adenylyltransferase
VTGPSVLTIGNFDGVHSGHRRIIQRTVELAKELHAKPSVLTFDPHPAKVVAPERAPKLLSTPQQRSELMRQLGIEQVLILPFGDDFSRLSPEEFAREVLVGRFGARAVLVGDNFHFGCDQAGDVTVLRELGGKYGFQTEVIPGVVIRGQLVSSTAVRRLIEAGDVSRAGRFLERPYAVDGEVVSGHGIGSRQTVPTLNLKTEAEILPARGVYITRTSDLTDGRQWPSITNIGIRPTFDGDSLTIETFLLAALSGPDPQHIRVEFLRRVRDERKFDTPEALKSQIMKDVARANAFFRRLSAVRGKIPHCGKIGL